VTPRGTPRRILIAGGSGLIGRHLSAALLARGDEVLVLSRDPASVHTRLPGCAVWRWHPGSDGKWQDELDVVDAIVDLSGAPFFTIRRDDQSLTERSALDIGPLSGMRLSSKPAPSRPNCSARASCCCVPESCWHPTAGHSS
jgi:NAD dependent epimerase/dehydratase family